MVFNTLRENIQFLFHSQEDMYDVCCTSVQLLLYCDSFNIYNKILKQWTVFPLYKSCGMTRSLSVHIEWIDNKLKLSKQTIDAMHGHYNNCKVD